ncbi:MAG: DoxX family membrane protein [Bacteroidota bacterium]
MEMSYSKSQLFALVFLRILIGWHFLYEGLLKLLNPLWTSEGYLMGSTGPLQRFFHWLGGSDLMGIIDVLNITALILIGLSLTLGFRTRTFSYVGIVLLVLYYLAYPPLPGLELSAPAEGSYFIVSKNLIEAVALFVLIKFPTSAFFGIDQFFAKRIKTT